MSNFKLVKLIDPQVVVTGGLVPRGAYNAGTDYGVGDSVSYGSNSYVMFNDAPAGTIPTDNTYWQLLAEGTSGGGGDLHYEQSFTSSSTVVVTHNLGKKPAVTVLDSADDECEGEVVHDNDNQLTITFSAPFTGLILCN